MPQPKQIRHQYLPNMSLPYVPSVSPVTTDRIFVSGNDVLTSWKGYAERRPGWATYEASPTTFTGTIQRVFTWRRWPNSASGISSDFFVMLNEVTGSQSNIYKLRVGTDNSFVLLRSYNSTEPVDFAVSNNTCYFHNGDAAGGIKYDGTTVSNWGIAAPGGAPTTSLGGTGISAVNGGYQYVVCYYNSNTQHYSSPSAVSTSTGNFTNQTVTVTMPTQASDAQVTNFALFRTTDGGAGIYFLVSNSIANITGTTFADSTADTALSTTTAPIAGFNDRPPQMKGIVWFANRIWGFFNNKVYFSGWEEINTGVEEESFPSGATGNFYQFPSDVTGLAPVQGALLVFTASGIFRIEGDSLDTFRRDNFVRHLGVRNRSAMVLVGRQVAWLDVSSTIQISDGVQITEISVPIRNDISSIDHTKASLAFHYSGTFRWLMLLDGGAAKCRVYDTDLEQWMPPWTFGGNSIYSGETAVGVYTLFLGAVGNQLFNSTPSAYLNPNGSTYTPSIITNLFNLTAGYYPGSFVQYTGHICDIEYWAYECDTHTPNAVSFIADDDPLQATPIDITFQVEDAQLRTQGQFLLEKWAWQRYPAARRVALKLAWKSENANFKLYSLDVGYQERD